MRPSFPDNNIIDHKGSYALLIGCGLLLCLASVPLACAFGSVHLPFRETLAALLHPWAPALAESYAQPLAAELSGLDRESAQLIIFDLRLPRVLLALCAGAGLAVAGAVFQGILRNPLADPFTLGVSGGAAFGAALAISFGLSGAAFGFGIPAAAFAGAVLALAAVLMLGRIGGGLRHETLILAGIVTSALLAALIALIKALDESSVTGIVFWIMGSFQGRGWAELFLLLPGLVCGSLIAMALRGGLDMLSLGDSAAKSLGLSAARIRLVLLLCAGGVTASCVAVSGIIGFIGLIVPHLCRMLLGAAHGRLLPASALLGALLLLWSDTAARTLLPGGVELPVGVVTALLGGPFFCFILGRKSGRPAASPGAAPEEARQTLAASGTDRSCLAPPSMGFSGDGEAPSEEVLSCEGLAFSYGRKKPGRALLLEGISFRLARGEFAALLGPNGSGKSTLLHCLSGGLKPWGGRASVLGKDMGRLREKERARLLALLPQKPESVPALSAFRMTLMGRYAHTPFLGGYGKPDKDAALWALERAGALHLAGRSVDGLSGGELQRVLLARTFAQAAPVLLLDEATAGLDPAHQVVIMKLLESMNARGLCVLAAMHDLNLAALYCRRLIFIKKGRVAADGPTREVFTAKTLQQVYDCKVAIVPHPLSGAPQALLSPE